MKHYTGFDVKAGKLQASLMWRYAAGGVGVSGLATSRWQKRKDHGRVNCLLGYRTLTQNCRVSYFFKTIKACILSH